MWLTVRFPLSRRLVAILVVVIAGSVHLSGQPHGRRSQELSCPRLPDCTALRDIHSRKPRRPDGMMTRHKFGRAADHKLPVLKQAEAVSDVGKA